MVQLWKICFRTYFLIFSKLKIHLKYCSIKKIMNICGVRLCYTYNMYSTIYKNTVFLISSELS